MLQKFVIGTLATLNSVMGPMTDAVNLHPTYKLTHDPNRATSEVRCPEFQQSRLSMQTETGSEGEVTIRVQGRICDGLRGLHAVSHNVSLPIDLLDAEFIERLPSGASWVAAGIPSAQTPGRHEHVKIIKDAPAESSGGLTTIRVEWLPHDDGHVSHQPMTIWFTKHTQGTLPWAKIDMRELTGPFHQPLNQLLTVAGEIEPPARIGKRF